MADVDCSKGNWGDGGPEYNMDVSRRETYTFRSPDSPIFLHLLEATFSAVDGST